jgi:hypothetical protein
LLNSFDFLNLVTALPKKHSIVALLARIDEAYSTTRVDSIVDSSVVQQAIASNYRTIIASDFCKELLTKLLFMPTGHKVEGQLESDTASVTKLESDTEAKLTVKRELLEENPENLQTLYIFESGFVLDLSKGSPFSSALFKIIKSMKVDILIDKYKGLVYYKWKLYFRTVFIYCLLFWSDFILSYVYFGFFPNVLWLLIVIVVLTMMLLVFEIKCMFSLSPKGTSKAKDSEVDEEASTYDGPSKKDNKKRKKKPKSQIVEYLMNPSNYYDLVCLSFSIIAAFLVYYCTDPFQLANRPVYVWLRMLPVVLLGCRAITWLRVFTPTRYLITSVMSVFAAMVPFLTILFFFILIFASMWRLSDGLTGDNYTGEEQTFYQSLTVSLNVIFGNINSPLDAPAGEYPTVKFIIWIIGNVILSLTLLNFLIAVLSKVFEDTTENRSLHDLYELMTIIADFDLFFSGLSPLARKHRLVTLLFLFPPEEVDDTQELFTELNKQINIVREEIGNAEKRIGEKSEAMRVDIMQAIERLMQK